MAADELVAAPCRSRRRRSSGTSGSAPRASPTAVASMPGAALGDALGDVGALARHEQRAPPPGVEARPARASMPGTATHGPGGRAPGGRACPRAARRTGPPRPAWPTWPCTGSTSARRTGAGPAAGARPGPPRPPGGRRPPRRPARGPPVAAKPQQPSATTRTPMPVDVGALDRPRPRRCARAGARTSSSTHPGVGVGGAGVVATATARAASARRSSPSWSTVGRLSLREGGKPAVAGVEHGPGHGLVDPARPHRGRAGDDLLVGRDDEHEHRQRDLAAPRPGPRWPSRPPARPAAGHEVPQGVEGGLGHQPQREGGGRRALGRRPARTRRPRRRATSAVAATPERSSEALSSRIRPSPAGGDGRGGGGRFVVVHEGGWLRRGPVAVVQLDDANDAVVELEARERRGPPTGRRGRAAWAACRGRRGRGPPQGSRRRRRRCGPLVPRGSGTAHARRSPGRRPRPERTDGRPGRRGASA